MRQLIPLFLLLFITSCSSLPFGGNETNQTNATTQLPKPDRLVVLRDDRMEPNRFSANGGDLILFLNLGDKAHTLVIPELGISQVMQPGSSQRVRFNSLGAYSFHYREDQTIKGEIIIS